MNMNRPLRAAIILSCLAVRYLDAQDARKTTGKDQAIVDAHGDRLPDGAVARWGSIRLSNGGQLGGLAFSPDGKWLASGGNGGVTHLWDANTGKKIRDLKAPKNGWGPLAFSPDGKTLAASAGGKLLCLWQPDTGKLLHSLVGPDQMNRSVAFSLDNKLVAAGGGDGSIFLWEVATGKTLHVLQGHAGAPQGLAFAPDHKTLASTGHDGTTRLWDVATGQQQAKFGVNPFTSTAVAYADQGKVLITAQGMGDGQGWLRRWDVQTGKVQRQVATHKGGILCMALSPDGTVVATGGYDRFVRFWNADTLVELGRSSLQPGWVNHVALSPDGTAAWGTFYGFRIRTGQIRGLPQKFEFHELLPRAGHESGVGFLAFSADGKKILSTSSDNEAILWDRQRGKELLRLSKGYHAALSPDGKRMALADVNDRSKGISVFDTTSGKEIRHVDTAMQVFALALSPNNRVLVIGGHDGAIQLMELATGQARLRLAGSSSYVRKLLLTPDGLILAEAAPEQIRLWDTLTGKELARVPFPTWNRAMAFSRDGKTLAFGVYQENAIVLWDVTKGKEIRRFQARVFDLAFTPDNKTLIGAGMDNTIRLWDVSTGKVRHEFKGHAGWVSSVAISADGQTLASGGIDTTLLMWNLAPFVKDKPVPVPRTPVQEVLGRYFEFPPGDSSQWWRDLAQHDAAKAHLAIWGLASEPTKSLPVMKKWLTEMCAAPIDKLIAELGQKEADRRASAAEKLTRLGQVAVPSLQEALEAKLTPEARRHIERILKERAAAPTRGVDDGLRFLRVLEVLELIDTAEARALLTMVAKQAPIAQLAQDAKDALERLARLK
jgi:WD40 repeat protein